MAPKRILEDPPAASSLEEDSDAETMDEDEEEVQNDVVDNGQEESDEDEEEGVNPKKKPAVPNPESESDSETESDAMTHSPTASDFTVKPIVSKPVKDSPATGSKRGSESDPNPKDSKKKKGSNAGDDEDTKKGRLWGEDGEVAILEGMIEFKAKKGTDPSSNMGEFHEFLRGSLKADVSKSQLMDKVRRLKKKYYHPNADENPVFTRGHEVKLVDLSKKIWGVDGGKSRKKKSVRADDSASPVLALPVSYVPAEKSAVKMNVANGSVEAESDEEFWAKYPFLRDSLQPGKWSGLEKVLLQPMPSIGSSKAKGLDDRWRKLQVLETELVAKRLALEHDQTKLILDALKSLKD